MTVDEARAILLSFPGAEEREHMGHPDFRVGGKIFATLWPTQDRVVLRLPQMLAETLLRTDQPEMKIVSKSGGWLTMPLAFIVPDEFREWAEVAHAERSAFKAKISNA